MFREIPFGDFFLWKIRQ